MHVKIIDTKSVEGKRVSYLLSHKRSSVELYAHVPVFFEDASRFVTLAQFGYSQRTNTSFHVLNRQKSRRMLSAGFIILIEFTRNANFNSPGDFVFAEHMALEDQIILRIYFAVGVHIGNQRRVISELIFTENSAL